MTLSARFANELGATALDSLRLGAVHVGSGDVGASGGVGSTAGLVGLGAVAVFANDAPRERIQRVSRQSRSLLLTENQS